MSTVNTPILGETTLPGSFDALKQTLPPEGEPFYNSELLRMIGSLSLERCKALQYYGMGLTFDKMTPNIPFFDYPEGPDLVAAIADTYLEKGKYADNKDAVLTLTSLARYSAEEYLKPHLDEALGLVDVDISRLTMALQVGWRVLGAESVGKRQMLESEMSAEDAPKNVLDQMWQAMFGGSQLIIQALIGKYTNKSDEAVTIDHYARLADKFRSVISNPAALTAVRRLSGLDINSFMVYVENSELLDQLELITDCEPRLDEHYELTVDTVRNSQQHNSELDKIQTGCPVRHARGAIRWAPQVMLSACDAVASQPPLPSLSFR